MGAPAINSNLPSNSSYLPSSRKTFAFVISLILVIGALAVMGAGVAGYVGALHHLNQVQAIAMMAVGGAAGIILLAISLVALIKNCAVDKAGPAQSQAMKIHEVYRTRSQTESWLYLISYSPITDRESFKIVHSKLEQELEKEVFEISKSDSRRIETLFIQIQKNFNKLFLKQRKLLTYSVDFYDPPNSKIAFEDFFSFLATKAGNITSSNDSSELIEKLSALIPFCKWEDEWKNNGISAVPLNFLKDMMTLAVVGRIHKASYWHYLHVIGNCGHIY